MSLSAVMNDIDLGRDVTVTDLRQRMSKMPLQMMAFSRGLRSLYSEHAISGDQSATSFRKIRDAVRQDAVIYSDKVLPVANMVVTNMSAYFDNYLALSYEDWEEDLDEIIQEVEGYENACIFLTQMHEALMTSLKKQQDMANVSIVEMKNLSDQLKKNYIALNKKAAEQHKEAETWSFWGDLLAVPTLGISKLVTDSAATSAQNESVKTMAEAVAASTNAEINTLAAIKTQEVLIPAVKDFLEGLSVCQRFFAETKAGLTKMSTKANEASAKKEAGLKMKRHFKLMKANAADINSVCMEFIGSIGEVSLFTVCSTHHEAMEKTNF
jgi:hypothetical protein